MKKLVFGFLLVVMIISLIGCGTIKQEEQISESNTENQNEEVLIDTEESKETTDEDLTQYYDVAEYPGTARKGKVYVVPLEGNTYSVDVYELNAQKIASKQYSSDKQLTGYMSYECILVDNNTPNDVLDDEIAYIFVE